jgi:hypothetical protein
MKPGIAANVNPMPMPAIPTARKACQIEVWSRAKNNMAAANTSEPSGIIGRVPKRCEKAGRKRLETKVPTESGTSMNPATTTEAPKP